MELKSLRAFLKAAEFGNISQAALSLGLTQSALSRVISALEADLGTALFHRTGRGVTLTEAGEAMLARARRIAIDAEQLEADVRGFAGAPSGTVTLAILPSAMRDIAGSVFEEIRRSHPGIKLRILEGFSGHIEEWLADGRADIGIVSRYRRSHARDEQVIATSHLMLVNSVIPAEPAAGIRHPAAGAKARRAGEVRFKDLARIPLVLPANPNGMRIALDNVAHRLHVTLDVVAEADSLEAQKAIVERGGGYAILSSHTAAREIRAGELVGRTIVEPKILRLLAIATTTHHRLGPASEQVVAILRRMQLYAER